MLLGWECSGAGFGEAEEFKIYRLETGRGRLRAVSLAKVPAPLLHGQPTQIGPHTLGFVWPGRHAVLFRRLDLSKALTEEQQEAILGSRSKEQ